MTFFWPFMVTPSQWEWCRTKGHNNYIASYTSSTWRPTSSLTGSLKYHFPYATYIENRLKPLISLDWLTSRLHNPVKKGKSLIWDVFSYEALFWAPLSQIWWEFIKNWRSRHFIKFYLLTQILKKVLGWRSNEKYNILSMSEKSRVEGQMKSTIY